MSVRIVNLEITTHCNRRCENCSVGIGINRVLRHHPWSYFQYAAEFLYGIEEVKLLGGEPTFHPKFAEFVPRFKELFGCKRLTIDTNGWGARLPEWSFVSTFFDQINFSDYHDLPLAVRAGFFNRRPLVQIYDAGVGACNFTPRSRVGGGKPCGREWQTSGMIAYADGKVYGCCVAPGIAGALGLPVEEYRAPDGRTFVPPAPCESCFFSL